MLLVCEMSEGISDNKWNEANLSFRLASIDFLQIKAQCTAEMGVRVSTQCSSPVHRGQTFTKLSVLVVCLCNTSYVLCFLYHKEPIKL